MFLRNNYLWLPCDTNWLKQFLHCASDCPVTSKTLEVCFLFFWGGFGSKPLCPICSATMPSISPHQYLLKIGNKELWLKLSELVLNVVSCACFRVRQGTRCPDGAGGSGWEHLVGRTVAARCLEAGHHYPRPAWVCPLPERPLACPIWNGKDEPNSWVLQPHHVY